MNTQRKNIEAIFKDKLQSNEATVPEHLWDNIAVEITPNKDRRKALFLWYFGTGIAASLIFFTVLFFNSSPKKNNNTILTTTTEDYCPEKAIVNDYQKKESYINMHTQSFIKSSGVNNTNYQSPQNNAKLEVVSTNRKSQKTNVDIKNQPNISIASTEVKQISLTKTQKEATAESDKKPEEIKPSFLENISQTDSDLLTQLQQQETPKKEKVKKWSIQPQVTTFSYNTNGSSINSNFKNNPKDSETDLSYGMRIAYQATPKISIRTGINNARINVTTSNIGIETTDNNTLNDLFTNSDVAIVNLNPDNGTNNLSSPEVVDDLTGSENGGENVDSITSGEILQQIEYLEIPLEIAFKLLDKKIGVDIIGGFSTFIISKNKSAFESASNNTPLGEASTINNTSFSSNIGFAIDYRLVENLKLSIEPMLKFQFNSFDNSPQNQPYFIGVSSGVKWNF